MDENCRSSNGSNAGIGFATTLRGGRLRELTLTFRLRVHGPSLNLQQYLFLASPLYCGSREQILLEDGAPR